MGRTIDTFAIEAKDKKLLNSGAAARVLGVSLSEFKKRARDGRYPATWINENGWRYYSEEDLKKFKDVHTVNETSAVNRGMSGADVSSYDLPTSTKVITALNQGRNPAEIAGEMNVHALHVQAILKVWQNLIGAIPSDAPARRSPDRSPSGGRLAAEDG